MFWAWEKHQAVRESLREEGRKETEKRYMPILKQLEQEKGLTLEELLKQEGVK